MSQSAEFIGMFSAEIQRHGQQTFGSKVRVTYTGLHRIESTSALLVCLTSDLLSNCHSAHTAVCAPHWVMKYNQG